MPNHRVPMIGRKFNSLTVIREDGKTGSGNIKWLCLCDCGNYSSIDGTDIRKGTTKTCGCGRKHAPGEAAFKVLRDRYALGAKTRGLEFMLNDNEIRVLFAGDCHYCGAKPQQAQETKQCNGAFIYNGIDRVDNTKGYVTGNVVSCCSRCNYAKRDMSADEFIDWATRVGEHNAKR